MRQLISAIAIILIVFSVPFLIVWACWLFSFAAFDPRAVFTDVGFQCFTFFWVIPASVYYISVDNKNFLK